MFTSSAPGTATSDADQVSRLFGALADPTRVRILNLLAAGELCVCDLVETLDQPQPTVSRHLASLRASGLVGVRRRGRFAYYRLAEPAAALEADLLALVRQGLDTASLADERRRAGARSDPPPLPRMTAAETTMTTFRVALLADIHANLPAFEAVLERVDGIAGLDARFHLGDLVGYAPWPNEVVESLDRLGIAGVAGNYDSTVATGHEHCGCRYEDPRQEELAHESYAWTRGAVVPATRRRLGALPFRLDLRAGGGHRSGGRLTLVHGTPTLNTVYWTADRDDSFCRKMIAAAGLRPGDALAFGHTHLPWTREVDGVLLVNAGSVGRPKDGDPRAGFAVLTHDGERWSARHERVEYDVGRAARAIVDSDLPDAFAHYLESGGRRLVGDGA